MGTFYTLANVTKKETIDFKNLPAYKAMEITGTPAASAIVTWYLLQNRGDMIGFVALEDEDWPFPEGSRKELWDYAEVTELYLDQLFEAGILKDCGIQWQDEDNPECFTRDIRNAWVPKEWL